MAFTPCEASLPLAQRSAEALEGGGGGPQLDILTTLLVGFTFEFGTDVDFILLSSWQGRRHGSVCLPQVVKDQSRDGELAKKKKKKYK